MGSEICLTAGRMACGVCIGLAALAAATPGAASAAPKRLNLGAARSAARAKVLADPSYQLIRSTQPLHIRRCWRVAAGAVRCSLYRLAGSPCALDGGPSPGEFCAQVVSRRTWLVQVEPADPPAARVLRVIDQP